LLEYNYVIHQTHVKQLKSDPTAIAVHQYFQKHAVSTLCGMHSMNACSKNSKNVLCAETVGMGVAAEGMAYAYPAGLAYGWAAIHASAPTSSAQPHNSVHAPFSISCAVLSLPFCTACLCGAALRCHALCCACAEPCCCADLCCAVSCSLKSMSLLICVDGTRGASLSWGSAGRHWGALPLRPTGQQSNPQLPWRQNTWQGYFQNALLS